MKFPHVQNGISVNFVAIDFTEVFHLSKWQFLRLLSNLVKWFSHKNLSNRKVSNFSHCDFVNPTRMSLQSKLKFLNFTNLFSLTFNALVTRFLFDLNSEISNQKLTSSNMWQTSSRDDFPFKHLVSKLCPSFSFSFKNWMASYFVMHKWFWVAMLTEFERKISICFDFHAFVLIFTQPLKTL